MPRLLALPVLVLCVFLAASGTDASSALRHRPQTNRPQAGPNVMVVTDVFAADPASVLPQPGRPIHYVILGTCERAIGSSVAGERMPTAAEVEKQVVAVLAKQGFVRTRIGGPMPSIGLIIAYGPANVLELELAPPMDPAAGNTPSEVGAGQPLEETIAEVMVFNRRELANLVGALPTRKRWIGFSDAPEINSAAGEDRLYVVVGALDARKLCEHNRVLLWRTFMSIPSVQNSLPETLAILLKSGAPHFARDTDAFILVDDIDRREAVIEFGELQVLDDDAVPPRPTEEDNPSSAASDTPSTNPARSP